MRRVFRTVGDHFEDLLIWAPAVVLAVGAWTHRWTADDGFIDLHVVDNLLRGHGPVFNVGERVEVFTSPIWLGLLALCGAVSAHFSAERLPSEMGAVFLGIACGALGLACASLGARNFWRRAESPRTRLLPFGALVVVALVPFWDFTTSGLEGSLVFLWIGASFLGLTRLLAPEPERSRPFALAVLLGLGPLVRPDLGLFSLLFLATLVACTTGTRRRLACLVAAALLPGAYELFRMGYFAALVPNTALAKEAGLSNWRRGLIYLGDFLRTYQFWIPLAVILPLEALTFVRLRRSRALRESLVFSAPILGGLLYGLYVVRWGGDFLHARMLLPAVFAIVVPLSMVPAATFDEASIALVPWVLVSTLWFRTPYLDQSFGIERGRMNYVESAGVPHPVRLRDFKDYPWASDVHRLLSENPPPDLSRKIQAGGKPWGELGREPAVFLATNNRRLPPTSFVPWFHADIVDRRAAIGMYSFGGRQRVYVCDIHGLADPVGAHERYLRPGEKSGHDKVIDPGWCLGRILTRTAGNSWNTTFPSRAAVTDAQAALECGALSELEASVTGPLDARRFWDNLRIAPRLTRLRIPGDPSLAREELCGPKPAPLPVAGLPLPAMRALLAPKGLAPARWLSGVSPTPRPALFAPPGGLRPWGPTSGAAQAPLTSLHPATGR